MEGKKYDNVRLEYPERKLRNLSRVTATSGFVHMTSVDRLKIGSVSSCGGRQRVVMSVNLDVMSCCRVEKGKARTGVRDGRREKEREARRKKEGEKGREERGGLRKGR